MTKGIDKALGLPSLAELLKNNDIELPSLPDPTETGVEMDADIYASEAVPGDMLPTGALPSPVETFVHDRAMDLLFNETLKLGRDVADAGFQVDTPRMARFFEVANGLFKTAGDMATSKHEHQLRAMKMAIELKRLELAEKQAAGTGVTANTTQVEGVFVADRNELIAARIAARKKPDGTD